MIKKIDIFKIHNAVPSVLFPSRYMMLFLMLIALAQCDFLGFKCCKFPVINPSKDVNGYKYGYENGKSCVTLSIHLIITRFWMQLTVDVPA
jgi:hypothetical protein